MNFDIDCLRSFMVVADTLSVSRAAESVGRSQSTVSQQIAKLEAQVGKELLARRKGRVINLTSEGGKLVQYARRILQLNDEAYASMSDDVLTGFVRLGVPLDFFGRDFTTWLARFKNRHPMVGLEVEANQSENLMKRSARGEFDLAFFKQQAGARSGTVTLREQLVWVCGPNYSPDGVDSVPLILFPEGCAYRHNAISALRDRKVPWHVSFVSPSFECLKSAAVEGMGITVLARALVTPPLRVVRHGPRLPQLPAVELVYSFVGAATRASSASSPIIWPTVWPMRGRLARLARRREGYDPRVDAATAVTAARLDIQKLARIGLQHFGRISSRMSSLAKSASQRSGVITGQSEPNSILSWRIELM